MTSDQTFAAYLATSVLFVYGMMRLRSPLTARGGNLIAAAGMIVAIATVAINNHANNGVLIIIATVVGAIAGVAGARRVRMTAMPQMVALFNGMGGGAAALVAAGTLIQQLPVHTTLAHTAPTLFDTGATSWAAVSVIIGSISFSGSLIAFAKLQELMHSRPVTFPYQHTVNAALFIAAAILAVVFLFIHALGLLLAAIALVALALGVLMVIPIGGGDMPVVISLLNSCTGVAAAATGFDLLNPALIVAGTLVGASGTILTIVMCKAMNRSLFNVVFGAFGTVVTTPGAAPAGAGQVVKSTTPEDVATSLAYGHLVIIVPGYGLAVARAQQEVREIACLLEQRGVTVKFAIHPVAGRMPGHMNVLLAEANVPYDQLFEMEAINGEFAHADVALVVGANDVTNPAARTDPSSDIYGMPILNVDQAGTIVVLKRSMNPGFAGIDNPLFYNPKCSMLFGDARDSLLKIITALKEV
ncbi:MAG TPA: NAD(P)(+) transhydrogenase (Re/Si-specific) subunit beta [Chloroflexota bacterium]|nr:NAD(P)(+) transhydrogenase (Re/Si-specific) subunit beta [Chloroflexota bacterium]